MKFLILLPFLLGSLAYGQPEYANCRKFKGQVFCIGEVVGVTLSNYRPSKENGRVAAWDEDFIKNGKLTLEMIQSKDVYNTTIPFIFKRSGKRFGKRRQRRGGSQLAGLRADCPIKNCKGKSEGEIECEDYLTNMFNLGSSYTRKFESMIIKACKDVTKPNSWHLGGCVAYYTSAGKGYKTYGLFSGVRKSGKKRFDNKYDGLRYCVKKLKKVLVLEKQAAE
jgi:hypothetical protein